MKTIKGGGRGGATLLNLAELDKILVSLCLEKNKSDLSKFQMGLLSVFKFGIPLVKSVSVVSYLLIFVTVTLSWFVLM